MAGTTKQKQPKRRARATPQIKLSIPEHLWPKIREAMAYDGQTRASVFALAAVMQRTTRLLELKATERGKPPHK